MLLLDTHSWIWWITQAHERFSANALDKLKNTADPLAISALSIYELSVLVRRQRVTLTLALPEWLPQATDQSEIQVLPVTPVIAQRAGSLDDIHGDPIDRVIIATTLIYDSQVVSSDNIFPLYPELQGRLIS